jgi:flagellar biosynthesis anti-sigma factor FlgM
MKVQNDESIINIRSLQKSSEENTSTTKSSKELGTEGDQVQLSSRAKEFQRIKDLLETIPGYRPEKVAELKKAIEQNTYNFDTQKAAVNLVKESLTDLLIKG